MKGCLHWQKRRAAPTWLEISEAETSAALLERSCDEALEEGKKLLLGLSEPFRAFSEASLLGLQTATRMSFGLALITMAWPLTLLGEAAEAHRA